MLGQKMEIDGWVGSYKIRAFPWIDDKLIYFNVQCYTSGQSIEKLPASDKTVYVTNDDAGQRLVFYFTDSLANHVANMQIADNTKVVLTAEPTTTKME